MAIYAQCPRCRKRQSLKNKACKCGENLDRAKRSGRVKYWISYNLPSGKSRRECVGYSLQDAKDAEGKRRAQKREGRFWEMVPESKITFSGLSEWYLNLEKVRQKASYRQMKIRAENFNAAFGKLPVKDIKPSDLEDYQMKRKSQGRADATIDDEITQMKTMVRKAFQDQKIGGDALRAFDSVKKLLKRHSNARDRILSRKEYQTLLQHSPKHLRGILAAGYWTGMRLGEILNLTVDKVDLKNRVIKLEATDTKDHEPRTILICDELFEVFKSIRLVNASRVFLYKGKSIDSIKKSLMAACEGAGIPYGRKVKDGFTFHDLRHTFNTNMRKIGIPESVIMKMTGHSTREMFDRYNTVDLEDARDALRKLEMELEKSDQNSDQKKEGLESPSVTS